MKKLLSAIIICLCLNPLFAQTVYKHQVDGEIYVKFTKAALKEVSKENPNNIPLSKLASVNKILSKYGVTRAYKPFYQADDDAKLPYILKFEFSKITKIEDFINEIRNVTGVEYAEKVSLNTVDALPNDPTFGTHLNQINAQNAWNVFNSTANGNSNITVAIVDNAVSWTHTDLVANTFTNTLEIAGNLIDDDGNGYVDDRNGWDAADNDNNPIPSNLGMNHGSHCAGIAGARTDNGIGIASIGWNIKIIPVKCQTNTGSTTGIAAGYQGIIYAAKMKARVISCSWGGASTASSAEQSVIDYAWNRGCIVICAAGNDNNSILHYPGAYNNVYCVASVSTSNVKSGFSCFGTWVDISAPGENITSTGTSNNYFGSSGTSMATPLVAGLAGLMLSKCPFMTQTDVLNCISSTAVNIYTIGANATYSTGLQLGAGRIEAFQAMNCAAAFLTYAPIANFYTLTRNTCPNVNISFIDSSMYAPTSFTWTFQGGTPATSTSSNPSVFWTTPGTYSVSLIAGNANGTNTKIKLSYITIAGPIALPLTQGFQTLPFLPANWTAYNINNDANYFTRVTGATLGGFGTSTACVTYDNYNIDAAPDRDEMRTPKYTFSNVASARLRFDVAYRPYDAQYSDTLEVRLSTNCGANWTSIYTKGGATLSSVAGTLQANIFTPTAAQWRKDTIDISALTAGQGNVMFSFVNRGHYGQALYLDNINLAFPTPTVNFNLTPTICVGATMNLLNTSVGASSYTWTMTGGTPATSTATNPTVSYASTGIYSITLLGVNGNVTSSITKTVSVINGPTITVNTPSVCAGQTATLTASGATGYTWTAGPTAPSMTANPLTTTVYTVTGSNGTCSSVKTATIVITTGPVINVNTPTVCASTSATLTATGATNYTWTAGPLTASMAASPSVTTVYTVTGNNGGCLTIKTATIVVTPNPTVTVNNQTICPGGSATITATGATSYSWSTGFTSNPLIVSPPVTTTYNVIGTTLGCTNTKTVSVTVGSSLSVLITANPASKCASGSSTLSASGATNYTWTPGASTATSIVVNQPITATYTLIGSSGACTGSTTTTVNVIPTPSFAIATSPSPTICAGKSVTIAASGFYSIYTWSSPSATTSAYSATPATTTNYSVTGIGSGGCTTSSVVVITVVNNPLTSLTSTNANCSNPCSGIANGITSSGTAPYTYSLTGGSCTSLPCSSLCAGNYTLVTNDAFGCTTSNNFSIFAPTNNLLTNITVTNSACSTCSTGIANVNVAGGIGPYTYTWSPSGGNAATASSLAPVCYTVVVMDANGCSVSTSTCVGFSTGFQNVFNGSTALLVYPNPAQNNVTIEYQGALFNYTLYNNLGQLIATDKNNFDKAVINLNEFAKGIYLIEVEIGKDKIRKKLIIE